MNDITTLLKKLHISDNQWLASMQSEKRIKAIVSDDGSKYWLKKSIPAKGFFRYHMLNLFSKMMRLSLLKAVPQPGGQQALETEVRRLTELSKAGFLVPKIICKDTHFLLLEDIGESVVDEFKSYHDEPSTIRNLFVGCLSAIKQLHKQDMYMSQGFVRNILKTSSQPLQFGFIDFEDDPLTVMSLAEAQARDLLLFVNSTARFFVKDSVFFKQSIAKFLDGHKPAVIDHLQNASQRMMWITKVPLQKFLGHDYQKLKTGILALEHL